MQKKLILTILAAGLAPLAAAANYTQLSTPWCDNENHVIYDGKGFFAVQSPAETCVEITINIQSLHSFSNSNDYKSGNSLLVWDADKVDYGIGDNADTSVATGSRSPYITGFCMDKPWKPNIRISYDELKPYAGADGLVTLRLSNKNSGGVTVTAKDAAGKEQTLYSAPALRYSNNTATQGYHINLNYVTAVNILTPSTLDTTSYTPPSDYTKAFDSKRTDGTTLKRVMFMGDSITHGVNDQTWRWQLFKTLVDNGIEAEIVGPRSGYTPGYTNLTTPDAGDSYGGVSFPNVHLAQSSGRTHNIISGSNAGMSGVNYGGHSTRTSAETYNCDTWCCLMGTNDLLSDAGYTPAQFAEKMQRMLGGRVTPEEKGYSRARGKDWGTMGKIAADVLQDPGDVLYIMAVPCWGNHGNNNEPERHLAVQQYNNLLKQWTEQYTRANKRKLVFVDINKGLADAAHGTPFSWPDSMSNRPGRDGLHPNAQGSLIIAGNLARAMGLAGRTAGLPRAAADDSWKSAKMRKKGARNLNCAKDAFTADQGFSVDCRAVFGNGSKSGWSKADTSLNISVGDGTNGGTLRISESSVLWGDTPLYCTDCSALKQNLRIVWHKGDSAGNVCPGFYVWVGDMLIGQGLPADSSVTHNGIRISTESGGNVTQLRWKDKACAPVSSGKASAKAFRLSE